MQPILYALFGCALSAVRVDQLTVRDTNVQLRVVVQNIAFTKVVEMVACSNQDPQCDFSRCNYSSGLNATHEIWSCNSPVNPIRNNVRVRYQVSGRTFFDNGPNGNGYPIAVLPPPPPPAAVGVEQIVIQDSTVTLRVSVQNIAYTKVVEMIPCTNQLCDTFPCRYASSQNATHEIWTCSSQVNTARTSLRVRYQVSGRTFFDNGPQGQGYPLTFLPPPTKPTPPETVPVTTQTVPVTSTATITTGTSTSPTAFPSLLPGCSIWNGLDSCRGDQTEFPADDDLRRWQTPPKGSQDYQPAFQSFRDLVGYVDITYNPSRTSATITVRATSRLNQPVECSFNRQAFTTSLTFQVDQSFTGALPIRCRAADATLELDDTYFYWDQPRINRPETEDGQKGAIAELFGWPYVDIEKECDFLGKAGYMGLKIWPPNEHLTSDAFLERGELNPWYFVYQPVSYRLQSRQGSLAQLRSMIVTCRQKGVRVFADAVVNHMVGAGESSALKRDLQGGRCFQWGPKNSTAGSPFFTHSFTFQLNEQTGRRPALEFPAVPYGPTDFHCERTLGSYSSGFSLNFGWLVGLTDLNTGKEYVRERIATYMATLLSVGFSGFRIDAAKVY
jgi:alpha-amylase